VVFPKTPHPKTPNPQSPIPIMKKINLLIFNIYAIYCIKIFKLIFKNGNIY